MYIYLIETSGLITILQSYFIFKLSTIQWKWQTTEWGIVNLLLTDMLTYISHDTCSNIKEIEIEIVTVLYNQYQLERNIFYQA